MIIDLAAPLTPEQWRQMDEAIKRVLTAGHGDVRMTFEDGHPSQLHVTVARLYVSFEQVPPALAAIQTARDGELGVIVRNSRATRLQVTTQDWFKPPAPGGAHV